MPKAVPRLILFALSCAAGVAMFALLFYGSDRFNHYDSTLTAHLLAEPGSRTDSVANMVSGTANFAPLVVALIVIVVLGLVWRRPWHLLVAIAVFVLANFSTQLMKAVLAHPRLQGALGASYPVDVAYPSGHTTAAVSGGFALWLVTPPKWRGYALLFAIAWAVGVGVGVVIGGWHFISDVLGAVMVVGFWASLGLAALVMARIENPADWKPVADPNRR
ncbi:MAG: phosphatase PAP2 family protein [Solirubrobacterales bacterium]